MGNLETTSAAATATALSKWYLYRNAHKIPAARRAGRAVRWDVGELKEWMRREATAKASSNGTEESK